MKQITGYKVFNPNWTYRGFQYEVGEIYELEGELIPRKNGINFYQNLKDCFSHYKFTNQHKIAEVLSLGDIKQERNKIFTNKIKILREITWEEILDLINSGLYNSGKYNFGNYNSGDYNYGHYNSGDYNFGNYNSGHHNSGTRNSGNYNVGSCNTGKRNSGHNNSGNHNSGDYNSGYRNSGYRNSGVCNSGHFNSGDRNTGHHNSGNYNSGNHNSGDYNSGDYCTGSHNISNNETGYFCTDTHTVRLFDVESNLTQQEWESTSAFFLLSKLKYHMNLWIKEKNMTHEEKIQNPEYQTTCGYFKVVEIKTAYRNWWNNLSLDEKIIITKIPNFNSDKFYLITGIRI